MKTNADVIREMSDEELSKFLFDYEIGFIDTSITHCNWCKKDGNTLGYDCDDCRLDWLKRDSADFRGLKYGGEEE